MQSIRREFDQFVNYRPVRLFHAVRCPLANVRPGDMDFIIIRENTEGEYTYIGGTIFLRAQSERWLYSKVYTQNLAVNVFCDLRWMWL